MSITKKADLALISETLIAFSFSSVFWIDASSGGTVTQALKGICSLPAAQSSGLDGSSVAAAPAQSQLKPEAEPSLAKAQPELPSDGSHILANSGSG